MQTVLKAIEIFDNHWWWICPLILGAAYIVWLRDMAEMFQVLRQRTDRARR